MTDKELQTIDATPAAMIQAAIEKGADPAALTEMYALYERHQANEARKAYNRAIVEFKRNVPIVVKDKENTQYGSKYVSKQQLVNTINPVLAEYGLNACWSKSRQDDGIINITCVLTHEDGHSEEFTLGGPPDTSGKKNALQQIKSTKTYLEIATFESLLGIAASDDGDDDGAGAGQPPASAELITDEQALELEARAADYELTEKMLDWIAAKTGERAFASIPATGYARALVALNKAIKGRQE